MLHTDHTVIFEKKKRGSPREKCLNSEFYWSVFFRIRTEHGDL